MAEVTALRPARRHTGTQRRREVQLSRLAGNVGEERGPHRSKRIGDPGLAVQTRVLLGSDIHVPDTLARRDPATKPSPTRAASLVVAVFPSRLPPREPPVVRRASYRW